MIRTHLFASTAVALTLLFAFALATPVALAEDDPSLNESDFDTSVPEGDDGYTYDEYDENGTTSEESSDDGSNDTGEGPTLDESDFDTSVPPGDDSYLDDEWPSGSDDAPDGTGSTAESGEDASSTQGTPGPGLAAALGALALAGLAAARRRR